MLTHTFDAERLGRVAVGIIPWILFVCWLAPGSAEYRMIGNLVLDTELAEPETGKVDLYLGAEPPLRVDRRSAVLFFPRQYSPS
jgi:hypothetical protein